MSDIIKELSDTVERQKENLAELLDGLKKTNDELQTLESKFDGKYSDLLESVSEKEKKKSELTENHDKLKAELEILQKDLEQLKPQINALNEEVSTKEADIKTLNSEIAALESSVEEKNSNLEVAKKELGLKTEAMDTLLKSISEDVDKAIKRVEAAEAMQSKIPERNLGTSFLLDRGLEGPSAPKAEIITIVAAEEPISTDDIKQKVTSISPVQVSRFIMMLEADGKIHTNADDLWELDKGFLEELNL